MGFYLGHMFGWFRVYDPKNALKRLRMSKRKKKSTGTDYLFFNVLA
jgi:hypothetical protein